MATYHLPYWGHIGVSIADSKDKNIAQHMHCALCAKVSLSPNEAASPPPPAGQLLIWKNSCVIPFASGYLF